jgi:hypothetical protein
MRDQTDGKRGEFDATERELKRLQDKYRDSLA